MLANERTTMFVFLVSHPTPSASTQGRGTRQPNVYIFSMHISPRNNPTITKHIVVMLNDSPRDHSQTIKMVVTRLFRESQVQTIKTMATQVPAISESCPGYGRLVAVARVET